MKTLLLLLFHLWMSAQVVTNEKGDTIFSITQLADTAYIGINVEQISVDIIPNGYGNHLFFVESNDKKYVNWHTVYGVSYFKKLE